VSTSTGLIVGVLLLLLNAFFVGAEFAVMSARRSQVEPAAASGSRAAGTALTAMENVSLMLACCQLGITVSSLGLGAIAEPALAHLLEVPFAALGVPENLLHPAAFAIALTVVVYLHVVIGEMVPKNLAIAMPERAVLLLATPLVLTARAVKPVIRALNAIANGFLRLARVEPKDEVSSTYTVEQVQSLVHESRREGLIEDRGDVLSGALEFSDLVARDVMVPLDQLVTIEGGATPADVERLVTETGFSRFPVQSADGDLTGYLHLKDVLYAEDAQHEDPVPDKRIRALDRVAADDEVEEAMASMQRTGTHLARVLDSSGRLLGVVFLEDVLEELVGEIRDEMRRERHQVRPVREAAGS
jgi:CBS domain containing-hemolysin-like protein